MSRGRSGNRIERVVGQTGLPLMRLEHDSGYSVVVSEYGAHVTSWTDPGERELLFLSEAAIFEPGKAIRGGIPVIFPQFSEGQLPKHGFARTMMWKVVREQVSTSGPVTATFRLVSDSATLALWPFQFQMELDVVVTDVLLLTLRVENTGREQFNFASALHTYFRVDDVAGVRIQGLQGCEYVDLLRQRKMEVESRSAITIAGPVDRVYRDSAQSVQIYSERGRRSLSVIKEGFSDTVIWNPWIDGSKAISDLKDSEYTQMLCVESGNILTPVSLAPGDLHTSAQILRADLRAE
jgi:glucose-6-phosphate 1-epimerase